MAEDSREKRKAERVNLSTEVEFHALKDIIDAVSVDVSETGIKLQTKEPLKVKMRFKNNGILVERLAQIAWAKDHKDGNTTYGFEFYEPPKITPGSLSDE
ncbi:MAG: PilZ domain-containing protein [Planctomycetota bacterium]|jgi:hypothetical protein